MKWGRNGFYKTTSDKPRADTPSAKILKNPLFY
jgi:hypothetical protein